MTITSGGNVGIGNSNASNKLSVLANGSTSTGADSSAGFVIYGDTQGSWMSVRKTSATPSEGQFGADSTGTFLTSLTDHPIVFRPNNTERMRITSGGNVGIGMTGYGDMRLVVRGATSNSSNFGLRIENSGASVLFQVRNDGLIETALGTGTVYSTGGALSVVSDMNLKIEDGYIDNALEKVLNLKPRYFHWKEESKLPTDLRQLGFYAQEVNLALGEEAANTPKENQYFGINDRAIIAFLTKAIQEQQAQIEKLSNKIVALESK
jgi:hypothetical protein